MAAFDSTAFPGTPGVDTLQASDANWIKVTGFSQDAYIGVDGNYACNFSASTPAYYRRDVAPPSANYSVSADIAKLSGVSDPIIGVLGRCSSAASTFYTLEYKHDITGLRLFSVIAGTPTQIGSTYTMTLTSTPVRIRLEMDGDQISGYVDEVLRIGPVTNTDITAAGFGGIGGLMAMRQTGTADAGSLDNYEAEEIGGGGFTIASDQGSYSLTGQSANLLFNRKLTADYGTYALTGQDVGLLFNRLVSAAQGSYALTGQDATLTYTQPGVYSLTADSGTYNWTVSDAFADYTMVALHGTYDLTGQDATLTLTGAPPQDYVMSVDAGYYSLTGRAAALRWSGAPVVPSSGTGLSMSMRIGL